MPTWPTSKPDSTKFDADSDRISTSRPELKTMSDAVNSIVDFIQPSGITDGQVLVYDSATQTMIPGSSNLTQLTQDLDVNDFKIVSLTGDSAGERDIVLETATDQVTPGSLGNIVLRSRNIQIGNSNGVVIEAEENTDITLGFQGGTSSIIRMQGQSGGFANDIELRITSSATGRIWLNGPVGFEEHTGTPSNTSTPAGYLKVKVVGDSASGIFNGGEDYYIPLYQ